MARVLIVDDDQGDRLILATILERAGHEVYFASDSEALQISLRRSIDVVVTDLQMPKVHGLELIMTVRKHYPEAGIIALSATGQAQLDMAEAVGATAALSKPVDPDELLKAIAKAVPGAGRSVRGQRSS